LSSTLGKRLGCAVVLASLAFVPASPAQDAPLGVVLQANLAHIRQSALSQGASVFAGEEVSTDVGGTADLRIATARFSLAASSEGRFYAGGAGRSIAELSNGTLTFRRDGSEGIEVVASDVKIVPKGDGPVIGQVTIFSPCRISVTSLTGELVVTAGGETHVIAEKESYSVLPEQSVVAAQNFISPDDPAYHASHTHKACTVPKQSNGSGRFTKIGIVAGAAAAAAILLISRGGSHSGGNAESPDRP
jgi:hypothetical protein